MQLAVADPAVHKLMLSDQHLLAPDSVYRDPALVERIRAIIAGKHLASKLRLFSPVGSQAR
ncbi:MAG: hypothetical protein ABSB70_25355 [Candidatus Velthaea sp.]